MNIITGDGRTGEALVTHPGVDKIAFTGSTDVGRLIRTATAGSGKKLSLELGGKSPFIVFPDADLDSVVEGVVDAIWFNQGQVCCAGSRILVQEGVAERLVAKLKGRMETLRVGDPLDKAVDMGAIIAPVQLQKIQDLVQQGRDEGAVLWQPSWSCPREGWFFPPSLFTEVAPAATIAQVEIFGPVVVLMTFRTPVEAVELANNTRYGLAASVWTENINLALDVAPQLKAGTVWINCTNVFDAASGFGGYRESGFGREGGREGLREYVRWAEGRRQAYGRRGAKAQGARHGVEAGQGRGAKRSAAGAPVRASAGPRLPPSTAPPSCTSAARRRGPIRVTACRCSMRRVVRSARWGRATGRTSGTPWRPRGRRAGGPGRRRTRAPRCCTTWPRTWRRGRGVRPADRRAHRRCGRPPSGRSPSRSSGSTPTRPWPTSTTAWSITRPIGTSPSPCPSRWACSGLVCPESPSLLGFVSLVLPAIAMGNTVVAVPSTSAPLLATDFYQVLDTSDVPAGVVNIVTGLRSELAPVLAAHDDVDGIWYFGSARGHRRRRGRAAVGGQHEAHLGGARPGPRLDRPRPRRGGGVPGAGDPGEEHLGAIWRVRGR